MENLGLIKLWFGATILLKAYAIVAVIMFVVLRFKLIRRMFLGRDLSWKEQLIVGIGTYILSILVGNLVFFAKTPPSLFAIIAGYYGGWQIAFIGGLLLASWTFIIHLHPIVILSLGVSGITGYLIRRYVTKNPLIYLVFIAGVITIGIWAFSRGLRFDSLHIYYFAADQFVILAASFLIITIPAFYWLCRLMEYLAGEEERESAKVAAKVLKLSDSSINLIRQPEILDIYPPLCQGIAVALDAPFCIAIFPDNLLFHSSSNDYPHFLLPDNKDIIKEIFLKRNSYLGDHRNILQCNSFSCSLGSIYLFPVHNGEDVKVTIGIIMLKKQVFSKELQAFTNSISALLSSEFIAQRAERQKLLLEETKYKFLKAQIQPHFLFNALNTIASFIKSRPDEAETLIVKLSQFLLHSFTQQQKYWPFEKELELLDIYLTIEKARFGNKLNVKMEIDESVRKMFIPPMLLQPLVENAIKHGISVKPDGGNVSIRAYSCNGGIQFEVTDDGVGFAAEGKKKNNNAREGVGLENVKERIIDTFGQSASFTINSSIGKGTTISFFVPNRFP